MLRVGQKLWLVYSERGRGGPCEVEVIKVGRKWATLNWYHGRIDIETLCIDSGGYASAGRCYTSREEYERERDLSNAWSSFRRDVHNIYHSIPEGLTVENIKQARALIFLPEKDVP